MTNPAAAAATVNSGAWSKRLVVALCLLVAAASIGLIASNTIVAPDSLGWNRWAFYEWLINYQGGFVRRGVVGELIHRWFPGDETAAVNYLAFGLGAAFVVLSTRQILTTQNGRPGALLHVFAPAGIFWLALANQFYYRKEMFFHLAVLAVAALYRRRAAAPGVFLDRAILALIALFSLVLPLVHETYLFFCALFFAIVGHRILLDRFGADLARGAAFAFLAFNAAVFFALSAYAGSAAQSEAIWNSLSPEAKSFAGGEMSGAVAALGWSVFHAVLLPAKVVISGFASFYVFALALLYLIAAYLHAGRDGMRVGKAVVDRAFAFTFAVVALSFLPLFVVGEDWGRWVFGIFHVFVTLVASRLLLPFKTEWLGAWRTVRARLEPRFAGVLFVALMLLSLLTRVPECCLQGSGHEFLDTLADKVKLLLPPS